MRKETKLIKEVLKKEYPDKKFRLNYMIKRNYVDSSDILKITCDRYADIDDVIRTIKQYTHSIAVYEKGSIGATWIRSIEPEIFSISDNKYVECGLLEFIEVGKE